MSDAMKTRSTVSSYKARFSSVLSTLRSQADTIRSGEVSVPRVPIAVAAEYVGRSAAAIREAEKDGRLPGTDRLPSGRRVGYTIKELNDMRIVFGTRPWRAPTDPVSVIAVQNFKGGVGKSTISIHLAQYLCLRGYRTLLIDCDSQASTTSLFNYVPDLDLTEDDTIYRFLRELELPDLRYAIRPTHWDGLSLIPANLRLYAAEYEMAARLARGGVALLDRLAQGVASVASDYDVIIMDPPPALGTISLSVMRAANALLIPVPPTVMDFASTSAFMAMMDETFDALDQAGLPVSLNWLRLVLSRANENKSMQREIIELLRDICGGALCHSVLRDSSAIDNATGRLMSIYEVEQPSTSRETHNRCVTYFNAFNHEIELQIRKTWPSHATRLANEGVI